MQRVPVEDDATAIDARVGQVDPRLEGSANERHLVRPGMAPVVGTEMPLHLHAHISLARTDQSSDQGARLGSDGPAEHGCLETRDDIDVRGGGKNLAPGPFPATRAR